MITAKEAFNMTNPQIEIDRQNRLLNYELDELEISIKKAIDAGCYNIRTTLSYHHLDKNIVSKCQDLGYETYCWTDTSWGVVTNISIYWGPKRSWWRRFRDWMRGE